jgi:hypothetical protein
MAHYVPETSIELIKTIWNSSLATINATAAIILYDPTITEEGVTNGQAATQFQ